MFRKKVKNSNKTGENKKKTNVFKNTYFKIGVIVFAFTLIMFLMIIENIEPKKIKVRVGDIAPDNIMATKDIVDKRATEKLKQEAMDRVEPRYRITPSVQMKMKNDIKVYFNTVRDIKTYENISTNKKVQMLKEQSNIKLSQREYTISVRMDNKIINNLENTIYEVVNQIMSAGIKEEELEYEKESLKSIFESLEITKDEKELGISIINTTIQPNKFTDAEATQKKKMEEAEKVEPVIVKESQMIVRKGDNIDENILDLIKESGLLKEKEGIDFSTAIGTLIILLFIDAIIGLYLYYFNKDALNTSTILILAIIIISTVAISKGVYSISPYIIPIAAVPMSLAIIINPRLGLIINFILTFLIGLIFNLDEAILAMFLIGGSIGAFSIINSSQRYNIFFNGLIVGIINVLTILSFSLIKKADVVTTLVKCGYGILNGVICSILTIGTLPIWENVFQILTSLKLLELSNPNQPLLKRLMLEAPGTYHHSVLVGNLSEGAAEAIGANPLIARVGAYYHDVGKLKRPYFFKENQFDLDNPHDKLNPTLSTLIITNHTKEGLELADKYKLPKEIKDIIVQHHGETVVAYFYYKALQSENSNNVKIEDFRYKGPKPQTREAAIIMLADSVEAAVRSIKEPNKGKIEEMVRNIIKGKLEDGQLEECDLTLKDLNTIANTFCTILLGIFHDRIEYPKLDLKEIKGES